MCTCSVCKLITSLDGRKRSETESTVSVRDISIFPKISQPLELSIFLILAAHKEDVIEDKRRIENYFRRMSRVKSFLKHHMLDTERFLSFSIYYWGCADVYARQKSYEYVF